MFDSSRPLTYTMLWVNFISIKLGGKLPGSRTLNSNSPFHTQPKTKLSLSLLRPWLWELLKILFSNPISLSILCLFPIEGFLFAFQPYSLLPPTDLIITIFPWYLLLSHAGQEYLEGLYKPAGTMQGQPHFLHIQAGAALVSGEVSKHIIPELHRLCVTMQHHQVLLFLHPEKGRW